MRNLYVLLLILAFSAFASGQRSVLTGRLYDAYGAVIPRASITATDTDGKVFETKVSDDGRYELTLPYSPYSATGPYRMIRYRISADARTMGFKVVAIKDFAFVPAFGGKMYLDFAMDVIDPEPCGIAGDCGPLDPVTVPCVSVTKEVRVRPTLTITKPKKDNQ